MTTPRRGRGIWKAWADGEIVETREIDGRWHSADPMLMSLRGKGPDELPQNWRIRPMDAIDAEDVARALLDELSYRAGQARCDCAHPACKACQDDIHTDRLIAWAQELLR